MDSAQLDAVEQIEVTATPEQIPNDAGARIRRSSVQNGHGAFNGGGGAVALERPSGLRERIPKQTDGELTHGTLAMATKRAVDLVGSLLLLLLLSPLF